MWLINPVETSVSPDHVSRGWSAFRLPSARRRGRNRSATRRIRSAEPEVAHARPDPAAQLEELAAAPGSVAEDQVVRRSVARRAMIESKTAAVPPGWQRGPEFL